LSGSFGAFGVGSGPEADASPGGGQETTLLDYGNSSISS
jgi:hypothetical protein